MKPIPKTTIFQYIIIVIAAICLAGCNQLPEEANPINSKTVERLPGQSDSIPDHIRDAGEVLISYSDCYTCHKIDRKSMGPSFTDIAQRYPAKKAFVSMLARKIIDGGSGVWGNTVMLPHPDLSYEDSQKMVLYILSLYSE